MSQSLSAVQQIEFDALVKAEYASRGFLLRDSLRVKHDVIGATVEFRKVGQLVSVETAYQQSVTPQDPGYSKVSAVLAKFTTPTAVDTVQELTVNFDAKMENAMLVADAMGRRSDQITIDALTATSTTPIVDGGTNLDYDKYTQIIQFFEDNAVPLGERFVAMSGNNFRSLLKQQEFTSTFFTANRVLDKGMVREYLGMNIVVIPTMLEGGLSKTGNLRTVLAWHKNSAGMGVGHNFRTEINYIPEKTSWLVNGIFSAGAVVVDDKGVLPVICDETA